MQHYYLLLLLMNFKQLAQYFIAETTALYGEEEAGQLYQMVIEQLTGWKRAQLLMNDTQEVSEVEEKAIELVLSDLKKGRPLQHIFAEAWFYGLKFKVNGSVLIPRPETEELVDWILKDLTAAGLSSVRLLDIGTGSGCIAITLKKFADAVTIDALDVSLEALAVAKDNAVSNQTAVNFIHADIRDYKSTGQYEVIVSNPPYIKEDEREEMHQNVLSYEPHLALFVSNENPLVFYKSIADFALDHLIPAGSLYFEINEYLGKETIDMLKDKGFSNITLRKDMQGKDRMIYCTR